MKYLSIVLTAVMGLFFTQTLVAQSYSELPKSKVISRLTLPVGIGFKDKVSAIKTDTVSALLSKKQIEEKLERLLTSPPPPEKHWFGTVNLAWPFSNTVTYICPICGEKTYYSCGNAGENWLYTREDNSDKSHVKKVNLERFKYIQRALEGKYFEQEVQKIKSIGMSLDRSEFCEHCFSSIKEPTLYLLVNIEGESDTVRTSNIIYKDIDLLREFLNDSLVYKTILSEEPLVKYIERIKELLGIKDH